MKFKKITSVALSAIIALSSLVLPSLAAEILTFSNGGDVSYAIEIMADATAFINFAQGDSITVSAYEGQTFSVEDDYEERHYGKIVESTFQGNELTSSYVRCDIFGGENRFTPGPTNRFIWTGKMVIGDGQDHPEYDLHIPMGHYAFPQQITMTVYAASLANTRTETLQIYSVRVVEVDNEAVLYSGSTITVKDYLEGGNGFGFTQAQKSKIKNGSDFRLTVDFENYVSSTTVFSFRTDINTMNMQAIANRGDRKVVFENIPSSYFYDSVNSQRYGSDIIFENFRVTGTTIDNGFRRLQLTFNDSAGSTTASTPSTTVSTPNASGVYDEEPDPEVNTSYINYSEITLNPGASAYLTTDIDTSGLKRTTTSRNICRVFTSGRIQAVNPGTATIAITNSKGEKVNCTVTVKNSSNPVTSFYLNNTSGTIYTGSAYTLKSSKSPSINTDTINWSSSNPNIAKVSKTGVVTVVGTGSVQITAVTSGGISSTAKLTARKPFVSVTNGAAKSLKAGSSYSIKTSKGPSTSKLTYSTSNSSVARVSNSGTVTGVKKGTATISIKSNKGVSTNIKVTVT
ncbi:MAG: Ig-like domain-containing protein [Eubacterium sp.]|jgi:uncharacterized protein YjdB|nr:Ig-like domain-containing protein [Eubacterium sp.]